MSKDRETVWDEWQELVNMSDKELSNFLETEESKEVGDTEDGESTGHESGRRIIEIRNTRKENLSDDQWSHMRKTVSYIKRHKAQGGPDGDIEDSDWRYSLMNWGHDPLKDD